MCFLMKSFLNSLLETRLRSGIHVPKFLVHNRMVRRYVVEIKKWSNMTLELIARHGSLDGYFDISRNNFDIDKSLTFLVICY